MQEGERSSEIEELEETVRKKFKQTKISIQNIEKRMDNIEYLLKRIAGSDSTPVEEMQHEDVDNAIFEELQLL